MHKRFADFAHIRPHDIQDHCCIVVGTIQTLRVSDTEGRKVYAHNENLEAHFAARPKIPAGLETLPDGRTKYSFANLLHLHRPLMIVDEAHNAVTNLMRVTQGRVNPSAIVEFTATPRPNSNILHSVTAQELKREEMIKLPIVLAEHDSWQNAVSEAVNARARLAETASDDPDYLRPIVLFQAQKRNEEVNVSALRNYLIDIERIPEVRIAVATGDQRELDGIDLFDPTCPIEYVITVEALKEGWDCSFAYAFCSVARIRSAKDVEQLLGRVLRMPYAARRQYDDLNRAYAFLSEPDFGEAARALVDKLVAMGFEEDEARANIEPAQTPLDLEDAVCSAGAIPRNRNSSFTVSATPETLAGIDDRDNVTVEETSAGKTQIRVSGYIDEALEGEIADTLPAAERGAFSAAAARYRAEAEGPAFPPPNGVSPSPSRAS